MGCKVFFGKILGSRGSIDAILQGQPFLNAITLWLWNQLEPCGALPGTNPVRVPHFLFVGNRFHSASLTFPDFQREIQTIAN